MKYLHSYSIFEATSMEEAKYIEDLYLNSPEGQDLAAANRWGYRVPRTGKFFVSERYSEYIISKNPDGTWRVTSTAKAKQVLGDFATPQDCFRRIWAWIIIKQGGLPTGKTSKDLTAWLMDPACPVWGKRMEIDEILKEYAKSVSAESGLVGDISNIFSGPEWQEKFDLLGLREENDSWLSGIKRSHSEFYMTFTNVFRESSESVLAIIMKESLRNDWVRSRAVPYLKVDLSLKKQFLTDISINNDYPHVELKVGDLSLEKIETKVLNRYLAELEKSVIGSYQPGQHPVLRFIISIMGGNVIDALAGAVERQPALLSKLPSKYTQEVGKLLGYSDDEIDSIAISGDLGLI